MSIHPTVPQGLVADQPGFADGVGYAWLLDGQPDSIGGDAPSALRPATRVPTGRRGPNSDATDALGSRTAEFGLFSVSGQCTSTSPSLPVPPYWWTSPSPVYGPSFEIRLEAYCCWSSRGGFLPPGSPLRLGAQNSFPGLLLLTLCSLSPIFSGSLQGWTSSAAGMWACPTFCARTTCQASGLGGARTDLLTLGPATSSSPCNQGPPDLLCAAYLSGLGYGRGPD
uniref:Uncharacterized protein n=1 Tax=Ananas comosus var. bracteatus TaxID=296719 RepID=A0A6V7QEB3_ANACO|nr:unnamed protein product [Ananas comosus var. bracteatus]